MERLTNRIAADAVRINLEGLKSKGMETSRIEEEYIKLAEYENKEEDGYMYIDREELKSMKEELSTLRNKCKELEEKHWQECGQISEYDIEVRQLRKLLHRVRSYYGQTVSWIDLFEDDYMKLTGGNV